MVSVTLNPGELVSIGVSAMVLVSPTITVGAVTSAPLAVARFVPWPIARHKETANKSGARQKPRGRFEPVNHRISRIGLANILFPLTPALSLGERGPRRPLEDKPESVGRFQTGPSPLGGPAMHFVDRRLVGTLDE